MKSVNIGELKNQLSSYIHLVRGGEEVVVCDRNKPVARILPFQVDMLDEREAQLVASGAMKLPLDSSPMDWDAFFATPGANISAEIAVQALLDDREDR